MTLACPEIQNGQLAGCSNIVSDEFSGGGAGSSDSVGCGGDACARARWHGTSANATPHSAAIKACTAHRANFPVIMSFMSLRRYGCRAHLFSHTFGQK